MKALVIALLAMMSVAFGPRAQQKTNQPKALRVGGDYYISAIEPQKDRSFRVVFKAVKQTGKFDHLQLDTDHINFSVKPGQTVRISAEVLPDVAGDVAKVTQVLLHLPHRQGQVPVWMMSKFGLRRDLNAAKYLEMHAPTTDYLLF